MNMNQKGFTLVEILIAVCSHIDNIPVYEHADTKATAGRSEQYRTAEHRDRGFSLVEVLIVVAIMAILAGVAVPAMEKFYKIYKFKEYAYSMESLVKTAKLTAMQRSVNVGVCRQGSSSLKIMNMGADRSNMCSGTLLRSLEIEDNFVSLQGSGSAFDPRGFTISEGSLCATDGAMHHKVIIGRFGTIRTEMASGGCS